jgi:hypothetical protein
LQAFVPGHRIQGPCRNLFSGVGLRVWDEPTALLMIFSFRLYDGMPVNT